MQRWTIRHGAFRLVTRLARACGHHRDLGGHLKTGHTWTLQNRPTEANQNKSIYTLREAARANSFFEKIPMRRILSVPKRKTRQPRDATGAPTQRPEWLGAAVAAPPAKLPFWRESDKSQGNLMYDILGLPQTI